MESVGRSGGELDRADADHHQHHQPDGRDDDDHQLDGSGDDDITHIHEITLDCSAWFKWELGLPVLPAFYC